ncbi:hypothetical protein B0A78_02005 [Flavobacterium columnare NBRC 100251 = ATCC 23463]|uniref:Uncharacterized protein n=2 Tax=Flavobacterium columnare TaxID=996 RepID=G8X765_FLACA|nr:hypothetical protein [Flavobacterium columnare]AEW87050.1 hypothetical protein FCOL_11235 [Flavobacterium columnare ATCC 49512]AMO21075.1 hypothetical protein UN65_12670 [Flavobacterium columnare]ANO47624.1 hypothetical protein Pf1_02169 [Flavobacterium columnare]APT21750.1 hypothetical protein BU993_03325 [Flavobacterium columnare]AUX19083.1 hypothetical protein AQ623_12935 [Flavobacterium columnare]
MKIFQILILFFCYSFNAQQPLEQALELCKQKKYLQAKPILEAILKTDPRNIEAVVKLGEIAFYHQDWDYMVYYAEELVRLEPQKSDSWFKYGSALAMKAKNTNKFKALTMIGSIEEAFKKTLALEPKHIGARWALIILYCELPKFLGGGKEKAGQYAKELIALSPVDGYLAQGYIAVQFDAYKTAEFWLKKAYQIGHSKTTFEKLYDLYANKIKDKEKAEQLKYDFKK